MIREGFLKEVRVVLDKGMSWMIIDGAQGDGEGMPVTVRA